jgi:hypothetical protein
VGGSTTTTVPKQCDKPGWGKGDKNHVHCGPPGLVAHIEAGKLNGRPFNAQTVSATTRETRGDLLPLIGAAFVLGGLALAFRRRIA